MACKWDRRVGRRKNGPYTRVSFQTCSVWPNRNKRRSERIIKTSSTLCSRALLEKVINSRSASHKVPHLPWTQGVVIVFESAHHGSEARWIQSTHQTYFLNTHLHFNFSPKFSSIRFWPKFCEFLYQLCGYWVAVNMWTEQSQAAERGSPAVCYKMSQRSSVLDRFFLTI
jgi:hypothetical protein